MQQQQWVGRVLVVLASMVVGCGVGDHAIASGTTATEEGTESSSDSSSGDPGVPPGGGSVPGAPRYTQFVVVRFDDGRETWSLVGPANQVGTAAALDPNGDVLLTVHPDDERYDSHLARISDGVVVDEVALDGAVLLGSLAVDAQRRVHAAGLFRDRPGYVAFDSSFEEAWPRNYTGYAPNSEVRLAVGADGSIVYAGWSSDISGPALTKLDSEGDVLWSVPRPGLSAAPADARISGLAAGPDGTVVMAMTTGGEDSVKLWLDAFAPDGTPSWADERESTGDGGITVDAAGNFVVSGVETLTEPVVFTVHLWLAAYDAAGTVVWEARSEDVGFGPIHSCGEGVVVTHRQGAGATVYGAQGQAGERVVYEGEGLLRGLESFCTSDGGIILVGRSTVSE